MKKCSSATALVLAALAFSTLECSAQMGAKPGHDQPPGDLTGRDLFVRHWSPGDTFRTGGDGLGPLFNDRSCAACHHQGGIGGGGSIEKNIDLLFNSTEHRFQSELRLARFHPGFVSEFGDIKSNIVLHRFGMDREYDVRRAMLVKHNVSLNPGDMDSTRLQRELEIQPVRELAPKRNIHLLRTQRNTTALFGAGLIDQITDDVILRVAIQQRLSVPGVSGRPSTLPNPDGVGPPVLGRFGWRGQTATLLDFVQDACATEIGLEVSQRRQTADPRNPGYRPDGVDLTDQQVMMLTQFVAKLPAPEPVMPTDKLAMEQVERGKILFAETGCAACHVESMGPVTGIFSDLLLHNMGPRLADPVPAPEPVPTGGIADQVTELKPKKSSDATSGSYGGGRRPLPAKSMPVVNSSGIDNPNRMMIKSLDPDQNDESLIIRQREWRTPPLWGVADSAPYMHDGRAATLLEAIACHGGEADLSRSRFFDLAIHDRIAIVEFLRTLKAPE